MDRVVKRLEVLAVVQARGGSKGLPRKNLRLLNGHPLIAYSIVKGIGGILGHASSAIDGRRGNRRSRTFIRRLLLRF